MDGGADETCPKCGAPRAPEACPRCGLIYERFDESVLTEGVPPEIVSLWGDVENDWDERSRHATFVERALAAGAGGYAASCYRRRGDDPQAAEQLERITARLDEMLAATASGDPSTRQRGGRLAVTVLLALVVAAAAVAVALLWRP